MANNSHLKVGMQRTQLAGTFRSMARRLHAEAVDVEQRSEHLPEAHLQSELCSAGYLVVVAHVECVVNDAYLDAVHKALHGPDARIQTRMATYWRDKVEDLENGEKGAGILRRYNRALHFAGAELFKQGDQVHDDAQLLFSIRNALTHFVSTWQDANEPDGMSKVLTDRGWSHRNPLRPPPSPPVTEGPLFPNHVLCSDGLAWAIGTADALTTEWTARLGLHGVWWRID